MDVDRHKQTTTLLRYMWIIIIRWPSSHNLELSLMCCNTGKSWWRPNTQFKFKHSFQSLRIELARHFTHRALTNSTVGSIKSVDIGSSSQLGLCHSVGYQGLITNFKWRRLVLCMSPLIADSGNVMQMHQHQLCFLSYYVVSSPRKHNRRPWLLWLREHNYELQFWVWRWWSGHRLGYIEAERIFLKNFAWHGYSVNTSVFK